MRILAEISKVETEDEFFVITAKDVKNRFHDLYFKEDKWKQIKNEYDSDDLTGATCILDYEDENAVSKYIQTDTRNKAIYVDSDKGTLRI